MQPWRQSLSLFVKPNVLPCLHFTQIKGLVPLQLSSSHLSHTHPHTTKQVSGLVLSDCPRSVWSFLQREFLAIVINLIRLIKLTWSDFRSSSLVCWACDCQPSFIAIGPELLCHWSGSSTALASCRYLLPLFLCWKLWGGRRQSKVSQAVVTVVRQYAENSPSAKTQGPEPSFLDPFCQFSYTISGGFWRNNLR